jgi:hypothetical protein
MEARWEQEEERTAPEMMTLQDWLTTYRWIQTINNTLCETRVAPSWLQA